MIDPRLWVALVLFLATVGPAASAIHRATARLRRGPDRPVPGVEDTGLVGWTGPHNPPHEHGGLIREIRVYADGRTEITRHPSGGTEIIPGDCADCGEGTCSWCAYYPVFDAATRGWVRRYQRCPAHAGKERQP